MDLRAALALLLGRPLGEEFGWRGYARPVLQYRLGRWAASLGLGLAWGVWHLPLFYIDGTAQARIPLAVFLLSIPTPRAGQAFTKKHAFKL